MPTVVLVTAHFVPSGLAGVHRVRILASGLLELGWTPIVVTVAPSDYSEQNDLASLRLLPEELIVERVRAFPKALLRSVGIGDVSLRAQLQLRRAVDRVIAHKRPIGLVATVLPGYTSMVGAWARRKHRVPFVLDYQDPWVPLHATRSSSWSKAAIAEWLARRIEPKVAPYADALTAVSDETLDSLRARKLLHPETPVEIIPIGADPNDHSVAREHGQSALKRQEGTFHVAYVGTLTAKMLPALRTFFTALQNVSREVLIHLHLIGTSAQPNGADPHGLEEQIRSYGLTKVVTLEPARIGYLDALRTMQDADLLLMVGSTDSHYTASKLFPYWLTGVPVLAIFHSASTIVTLAEKLGGVSVVSYGAEGPTEATANTAADTLRDIIRGTTLPPRNQTAFAEFSPLHIAQRYADLIERAAHQLK